MHGAVDRGEAHRGAGRWEAYTDNGREHTGLDVVEWARRGVELGAGEILLTSVDRKARARASTSSWCAR